MAKSTGWVNKDGLIVGFGPRSVSKNSQSKVSTDSHEGVVVVKLADLTALGTDATVGTGIYAPVAIQNSAPIPANATVHEVRVVTDTAAGSTGAADLLLGLCTISSSTGKYVVVDADGLMEAGASALSDFSVAGETMTIKKGDTGAGAYVGAKTVGTSPVFVVATYATEAYNAGALSVYVKYSVPTN